MKVLLFCDDYWHPGDVPENGFLPLQERGFAFDIIYDAGEFKPGMLSNYDVVILSKSDEVSQTNKESWISKSVEKEFIDYVENGGGLLVTHSGLVPTREAKALEQMVGGWFSYHPNACPVLVQPIKNHPIVRDVSPFTEVDEHYRIEVALKDADIFLASYSPNQGEESKYDEDPYHNTKEWISAAGFTRSYGKGRICALSPGHLPPVWSNPQYQKILENALNWCANKG